MPGSETCGLESHRPGISYQSQASGGGKVVVDDRQLRRAMVALRVVSPNSIRAIEDLIPILYPGQRVSYGAIQAVLAQAEQRATTHNAAQDLKAIKAGALDEMFSQGDPVLAGVDLETTYLFALALRATRSSADWAEVLSQAQQQGLELEIAVKDAARGIAAGVPSRALTPHDVPIYTSTRA